jgi:uncharacterized protein
MANDVTGPEIVDNVIDDPLAGVEQVPNPAETQLARSRSAKVVLLWRATWFQGGILVAGIAGVWVCGCDLRPSLAINSTGLAIGIMATVPLAGVVFGLSWLKLAPLEKIEQLVLKLIGPAVAKCSWPELAWLALLAGFSEEILFRGWLWQMVLPWGFQPALIGTSVLFGLAHPITRTYFAVATLIGAYLACIAYLVPGGNLWSAIVTHTLYDLIGLKLIAVTACQNDQRDRLEVMA